MFMEAVILSIGGEGGGRVDDCTEVACEEEFSSWLRSEFDGRCGSTFGRAGAAVTGALTNDPSNAAAAREGIDRAGLPRRK